MPTLSATFSIIKSASSRFLRGSLLVAWIGGLAWVSLVSLQGTLADYLTPDSARVERIGEYPVFDKPIRCPDGGAMLDNYMRLQTDPPPIATLLDATSHNWTTIQFTADNQCNNDQLAGGRKNLNYCSRG